MRTFGEVICCFFTKRFVRAAGRLLAPEEKSTASKVIRNVVFSALRAVFAWPIPFLLIPFILAKIGTRGYGTWAVFLTIIGFTSLSDFGLGGTLTKYVAQHYATGDLEALKRLLDTGLMLYLVLACLAACLLGAGAHWLVPLFFRGDTGLSLHALISLWYWLVGVVAVNVVVVPFYSVITGLQRMDLSNILSSFNSLAFALLAVFFLCRNTGVNGLLYASVINAFLTLVLAVSIVRRILPGVRLNPVSFDRSEMGHLFAFSLQIYVTQTGTVILNQIEKVYLAWFAGVVAVGWYNIAAEVAMRVRRIPELLLGPVMAAASELHAQGDEKRLEELYYRSHKYLAFVGAPIVAYAATVSKRLVSVWIGPGLSMIAAPLAVLVLVHCLSLTVGPGWLILVGQGNLKPGVYAAALTVLVNITVSFVLIRSYGFSGAVIGTTLATVAGVVCLFYLFNRRCPAYRGRSILGAYLKPVVCASILTACIVAFCPLSRMNWVGLVLAALVFGSLYLLALTGARFFDRFDLVTAENLFPPLRALTRIIPVA
jgi:O-antigen/teichoic acid export membrane protein